MRDPRLHGCTPAVLVLAAVLSAALLLTACVPARADGPFSGAAAPSSANLRSGRWPRPRGSDQLSSRPVVRPRPASRRSPSAGRSVVVLAYHNVTPHPERDVDLPPETFRRQMAWLASHGFHTITATRLARAISGEATLPEKPVVIEFDDGRAEQAEYAAPILVDYRMTATFFVIPSQIGQSPGVAMSVAQVRRISRLGFDVQSHTWDHRSLARWVGETERRYLQRIRPELVRAKSWIERVTSKPVVALVYPMGFMDSSTRRGLAAAGYQVAFTGAGSPVVIGSNDPFYLPRYVIARDHTFDEFVADMSYGPLSLSGMHPEEGRMVDPVERLAVTVRDPKRRLSALRVAVDKGGRRATAVWANGAWRVSVPPRTYASGFHVVWVSARTSGWPRRGSWVFHVP
jgi:peptidoglycan/xylan/chitin deacetylase (PgdA/CDA1 family)